MSQRESAAAAAAAASRWQLFWCQTIIGERAWRCDSLCLWSWDLGEKEIYVPSGEYNGALPDMLALMLLAVAIPAFPYESARKRYLDWISLSVCPTHTTPRHVWEWAASSLCVEAMPVNSCECTVNSSVRRDRSTDKLRRSCEVCQWGSEVTWTGSGKFCPANGVRCHITAACRVLLSFRTDTRHSGLLSSHLKRHN